MVAPTFVHMVVKSNRVEEMRDWYCKVVLARVVFENPMLCFLTNDEEHHRLAIGRGPEPWIESGPLHAGLAHSAWTFPDLESLLTHYEQLKAEGIEPKTPVQHGVTTSLYYRDPDGNRVELQVDNMSPADATRYMSESEEYSSDPVGPSFDPQLMLDELRAGRPVSELTTRSWALAGPTMPDPLPLVMGLDELGGA